MNERRESKSCDAFEIILSELCPQSLRYRGTEKFYKHKLLSVKLMSDDVSVTLETMAQFHTYAHAIYYK